MSGRGKMRARKRRMVGDARRVREMARRQTGRRFGRDYVVETWLLPLGVRVSIRLRGRLAMPKDLYCFGGKQHARHEMATRLRGDDERDF